MTRVAIQGIEGSYSSAAARELIGDDAALVECRDFEETFAALRMGRADYAVVPVANRIVGEIRLTSFLLEDSGFAVSDKLDLRIEHVLVGTSDSVFENIVSVRSHVEALKQCRRFLDENPALERVIGSDTASSIRRIVEDGDPRAGAVGSRRAADLYGAKVLRENIADESDNWTTFYLIGS
jgi:prephenate dehydratase